MADLSVARASRQQWFSDIADGSQFTQLPRTYMLQGYFGMYVSLSKHSCLETYRIVRPGAECVYFQGWLIN